MAHLGLTPQSIHQIGGFKVQGKKEDAARKIIEDAKILEEAGAFSLVLGMYSGKTRFRNNQFSFHSDYRHWRRRSIATARFW